MARGGKPSKHKGVKSKYAVQKELFIKKNGQPAREGEPWTQGEFDTFVTAYVMGRARNTIAQIMQRSPNSIDTYYVMVPVGDCLKGYSPRCLRDRRKKVWNEQELWFVKICKEKGWSDERIALAIGRDVSAIQSKTSKVQADHRPQFNIKLAKK